MIDVYLLCFNEEKILPFVIEHYKKYMPNANVIFYDNMSTDNSEKIILDSGYKIRKFDTGNTFDDARHMQLKNNCWKEDSQNNWVLTADLDELPCVTEADLLEEDKTQTSILSFEGFTFVGGTTGCDLSSLKRGIRDGGHDKKHIFNRRLIKEMNYGPGAHTANPAGNVKYSQKKYRTLHYKWISLEYVMNRHNMYAQRISQTNKKNGWGIQYYWTKERLTEVYNSLLPSLIDIL
jgi:glycosyltransferase involved in cell wall biosynthesis